MSDSVVKLRIDSKEYDANIKRAGDALTQYFQKVREGGGTLMHLDEGVMEAVKAMGELGTQAKNTKGGLRELTQATTDMTIAYRNLTDEEKNSPLGQAMAQSIRQMTDRAGQMRDTMDDVNLSIKNVASDTSTFDQFAQGIGVATAGFQGLTGAGKLLGIEMGNDVEVIAKLQAAMAVTNSLTTIQAALQKESALMQGLNAVKTAATSVAQQAYAVATGEATVAQIAFNVAADANPYGLILGAIGLVVGAIGAFVAVMGDSTEETDKNTEALKRQEHEAEIMKRRHQDMQQSIGNSVGSIEAKYKMLQLQWNSLKSDAEKTQFIKDQKNAFSDLGLKVNSVTQAQEALVNQAPKVIAALKAVAEAEAYSDLYKKSIQKKATEWDNRIKGTNTGDFYKKAHLGDAITDEEAKAAGVRTLSQRKVNATNPNSYNAAGTTKTESLTQEEINKVNVYRAQQAAQMRKQREKEYDDEINIYSSKWEEAQQKALTAQGNISGLLTSETKGGSGSGGNKNKEDVTYAEDSIMAQEILVQDLTQKWKTASAELKDGYLEQLNEAKDTLAEMTEGSDPDKLIEDQFPDMSKQNFDTGYSDSAQAKYDSARQDFALRGISNSDISSYISSIKGAIDQSDLGSDLYNKLTENLKDADAMQSVLTQAMASGAKAADLAPIAEELKAKLLEGEIDESTWEEFIDKINALITDSDLKIHFDFDTSEVETGLQKTEKDTKAIATAAQNVSSVVGTIGQAFNSIEDPAAKVMGTVMQAIATVASGYATATAQAAALGPWAWIAFAATGLATMISTISAIHQQTGYASGGIIPGNSYSGDNMVGMLPNGATVGLDAGELILNRSQQSSIASQLEGGPGFGNMQLETRIDAEELIIMLNNNGLRRGLGRFING